MGGRRINSAGQRILKSNGAAFYQVPGETKCFCEECYEPNCAECLGGRVCCYQCGDTATVEFGTLTIDPAASGEPYYAIVSDFASSLSGQTVAAVFSSAFPGPNFVLTSNVLDVDDDFAYFWLLYIRARKISTNDTAVRLDVSISGSVHRISRFCLEIGDPLPTSYCESPDELNVAATDVVLFNFLFFENIPPDYANCCEYTGAWDTLNPSPPLTTPYFSVADVPVSFEMTTCSNCADTDWPSAVSFDLSQLTGGCWSGVSGVLVANIFTGPPILIEYGGSLSGVTVQIVPYAAYGGTNPCNNDSCFWSMRIIQGGCTVIYFKCGGTDPTGTYTESGGGSTVDVT